VSGGLMKVSWIKIGFLSVIVFFAFQNCGKTNFNSSSSDTSGDVTDPVILSSKKCEYEGKEYWHSETIQTYRESSVAFNQSCKLETQTCNNGAWEGAVGYRDCGTEVPKDCKLGNDTIKHNQTIQRFESSTVAFDKQCKEQTRTCVDGDLSGDYAQKNCVPQQPPKPTGKFSCEVRDISVTNIVEDLYEVWSDGSKRKVETCSNWQSQRQNRGFNCGKLTDGIYDAWTTMAQQPTCCPVGKVTVNGKCMPIAQLGQACYGSMNCADGLECNSFIKSPSGYYGTCQVPK
jgi:hypothetical protein